MRKIKEKTKSQDCKFWVALLCTLKLRITKYEFYRNILNMVKFAIYANEAECWEQRGCGLTTIYTAAQQRASSCWGQIHHNLLYS